MRFRRTITVFTIAVFLLAVALSFVWLTKVRETEILVLSSEAVDEELYSYADEVLEKSSVGKSSIFLDTGAIADELEKNPYISVDSIDKVFPSKITAKVKIRKGRFVSFSDGNYYVFDSEFVLLDKGDEKNFHSGELISLALNNTELDLNACSLGENVDDKGDALFGDMVKIFGEIADRLNVVSRIAINGEVGGIGRNRVYFYMKTGVVLEFRFSDPKSGEDEKGYYDAKRKLINAAALINERYESLSEVKKSKGYLMAYLDNDYEVRIAYDENDR